MRYAPLVPFVIAVFLVARLARAQADNPQEPRKPELAEIQPLWAPYQAALKAVAAERDKKVANLDNIYLLNLDKMKKERAEAVDLDGALAVKAELDRLGVHQATTEEQRKAMSPGLRNLRASYDAAVKGYHSEALKRDEALLQKLVAELEDLQKRITTTGNLDKALLVKAEKERIAAGGATGPQAPAPAAPQVKVASAPAVEPPKVQPVVAPPPASPSPAPLTQATKEHPFENSLGMRFVPVPIIGGPSGGQRILVSIWETRVQDYQGYLQEKSVRKERQEFPQGPTHPAVNVRWVYAKGFCTWLTEREQKAGLLGQTDRYRLPTDHEWSCAVGLGEQEDPAKSPEEKSGKIADVYPWGSVWPPPQGAGNYGGEEMKGHNIYGSKDAGKVVLQGYRDGFTYTAPVGSFAANRFGLFDTGGNAGEWCEEYLKPQKGRYPVGEKLTRGGNFADSGAARLLASARGSPPLQQQSLVGFRVVLATGEPASRDASKLPRQ